MRTKLAIMIGSMSVFMSVAPVWAHHSFAAEYDQHKPVKLVGTVTKVELINPHVWIHIDVKDQDGKVVPWQIEAGAPNVLFRRGLTKDSLPVGTEIVVNGYQAKNGSKMANGKDVRLPNGQIVFLGSSGSGAPYDDKSNK
jgi:hypothetical protein